MPESEISLLVTNDDTKLTLTYMKSSLTDCSSYFAAMFSLNFVESNKSNVHIQFDYPSCLQAILDFVIKKNEIDWEACNPFKMLHTSTYFQIHEASAACKLFIFDSWLTLDNCLTTMFTFKQYTIDEEVLNYVTVMCQREFERIICTEQFLKLSYDLLESYLNMANLIVNDELDVFIGISQWIEYDARTRFPFFKALLQTVHFANLSVKEIENILKHSYFVKKNTEVQILLKMICDIKLNQTESQTSDNSVILIDDENNQANSVQYSERRNVDINRAEEELAKRLLEKPKRYFDVKFYLFCNLFVKCENHRDEEKVLLCFDPIQKTLIVEKKVEAVELVDYDHKVFNPSTGNLIHINSQVFGRNDYNNHLEFYENNIHTETPIYLQGKLIVRLGLEGYEVVDLNTNTISHTTNHVLWKYKKVKCCLHKGYMWLFLPIFCQENYDLRLLRVSYHCDGSLEIPPLKTELISNFRSSDFSCVENSISVGIKNIEVVLSGQQAIYIITKDLSLFELPMIDDESKLKQEIKHHCIGRFVDKGNMPHVYGVIHDGIIYAWVHNEDKLSVYTCNIQLKIFDTLFETKCDAINELGFNILGAFTVPQ
uniref:Ectoderm-neural cortex protein 1 n=1 Tax=Cacopsylla melanoneura TaxID=428564 RepID=A0A8D9BJ88_9HEMI